MPNDVRIKIYTKIASGGSYGERLEDSLRDILQLLKDVRDGYSEEDLHMELTVAIERAELLLGEIDGAKRYAVA